MPSKTERVNGIVKHSFYRATLALINVGLRLLFSKATGLNDRFYKTYIAFRIQEEGYIISYDSTQNTVFNSTIFDAIESVVSCEERVLFTWNEEKAESFLKSKVQEMIHSISSTYKAVKPYRILFETNKGNEFFYTIVVYQGSDWEFQRIPEGLILNYLNETKQKFQLLSKEICTSTLQISELVNQYINPSSAIRMTCENELRKLFGQKKTSERSDLFDFICNLACKPYEGAQNKGIIRFSSDASKTENFIRFMYPVNCKMENTREIRKLLEMTDRDTPLLVNQGRIIGLGKECTKQYFIVFEGNGKWKLYPNEKSSPIFFVEGNICTFTATIMEDALSEVFQSVFPSNINDLNHIQQIIALAKKQRHGTSIVICNKAREESARLAKKARAILIDPVSLIDNNEAILKLTSIDGALVISPEGICYSIGAILDGEAVVLGDTARGARYNSLNNYVIWRAESDKTYKTMAIVISEDQTVDIVPREISKLLLDV